MFELGKMYNLVLSDSKANMCYVVFLGMETSNFAKFDDDGILKYVNINFIVMFTEYKN
jgi:hypothetical protein